MPISGSVSNAGAVSQLTTSLHLTILLRFTPLHLYKFLSVDIDSQSSINICRMNSRLMNKLENVLKKLL